MRHGRFNDRFRRERHRPPIGGDWDELDPRGDGHFDGFGRHGGGRGTRGGRFSPRRERVFERGELRYVILDLLADRPRHGYDVIRALEERFAGLYSPSPGSVYPTLQLLEDQDLVTVLAADGKKTYTLTDAGRATLASRSDQLDRIRERVLAGAGSRGPAFEPVMRRLRQTGGMIMRSAARGAFDDPMKQRRLQEILDQTYDDVEALIADAPAGDATTAGGQQ